MHEVYGERKLKLFESLPRRVVELGPGTGANLRYYPPGTELVAIEPNLRMHAPLREAAATRDVKLEIRGLRGEALDLESESVDAVVCTLVLCSVGDPAVVLSEARRVLRSGGRFVFIEHVAASSGSWLRTLQNSIQRPWSYWFEGCRPNRETAQSIEGAGFASVEMESFRISSPFVHVSPQIAGVAVR